MEVRLSPVGRVKCTGGMAQIVAMFTEPTELDADVVAAWKKFHVKI